MSQCARPGCSGTIQDGFCDRCGEAPEVAAVAAPPPPPVSTPVSTPVSPPSGSVSRSTGSSSARSRGFLGEGLADLPAIPVRNPQDVILADPAVSEDKRYCSACGKPVGRGIQGQPGRVRGFCPNCRHPYDFAPKLGKGDLVAGQYRVEGALAHGGLGWIYLASDQNLDGKWMVLKGLLNAGDAEAMAAAEAERRFLISVDHPNIVKIFNFCRHDSAGYIVMEYVGGPSLAELRKDGLLPLSESIRYGLEILKAFGYLHDQGLVYCDLKPHNAIRAGRRLKLIDLGAVQRVGSPPGTSWHTAGYSAPEIETKPASVASDLYTVARTLAVLSVRNFSPTTQGKVNPLPADCGHDSFGRVLRRATDADPRRRFQSSAEFAEQLTGVLRELSAEEDGVPYPGQSRLFGPERAAQGSVSERPGPASLPVPVPDPEDPAASGLSGLIARSPAELVTRLEALPRTPESILARARVLAENGLAGAAAAIDEADAALPRDWRVDWVRGQLALAESRFQDAAVEFEKVLDWLPGELPPKLALGLALEGAGQDPERWYRTVWRTDHSYVGAAFGLARARLKAGDRDGAVALLDEVPESSSQHANAQLAAVECLARDLSDPGDVPKALERLEDLRLDARRHDELTARVLEAALARADSDEHRRELAAIYRRLAKAAATRQERHALVDRANAVRPRTWV